MSRLLRNMFLLAILTGVCLGIGVCAILSQHRLVLVGEPPGCAVAACRHRPCAAVYAGGDAA